MLWLLMAMLVLIGATLAFRRKRTYDSAKEEPWRTSLQTEEPLEIEEIRRAEEEWLEGSGWEEPPEDEAWR